MCSCGSKIKMFCIVQTRKNSKSKPKLTVVPVRWVEGNVVYWPRNCFVTLSTDSTSVPDESTWTSQFCKVVGTPFQNYANAEEALMKLCDLTDSEDALGMSRGTRSVPPKKKQVFVSKAYSLVQTQPIENPSNHNASVEITVRDPSNIDRVPLHQNALSEPTSLDWTLGNNVVNDSGYVQMINDTGFYLEVDSNNLTENCAAGHIEEVSNEQKNTDEEKNDDKTFIKKELMEIKHRLGALEEQVHIQHVGIEKLISFMADFHNLMQKKSSTSIQLRAAESQAGESFKEFENMQLVETEEGFLQLEEHLKDESYSNKFKRYLRGLYEINGKRDGSVFFKTLIRKMISPVVLKPYSWEGVKRSQNKSESCSDGNTLKSFKTNFPSFIKFLTSVLKESDQSYTVERSQIDFSQYLRQKNTEIKRFLDGRLSKRVSSKRKRQQGCITYKRNKTEGNLILSEIIENDHEKEDIENIIPN